VAGAGTGTAACRAGRAPARRAARGPALGAGTVARESGEPGPLETQLPGLPGIETRNREPGTPGNAGPDSRFAGPIKNGDS